MSLVAVVHAAVPWMINYQGRLTDITGKSVMGSYTMTFRLYDASTGGTKLWQEEQTVSLAEADSGIFNIVLGSVTVLTSVDFNTPMWLSVQVGSDSEMTPRQRLTATGYAMNADQIDSLDSSKFVRTDIDSSSSGKLTLTRSGTAIVITPSSDPSANTKLIDVQNAAGTSKFSVDLEGDVAVAGDLAVTGTISGSTSTSGTTSTTWTVDSDNTSGTEPASGAGLVIEGGSGDVSALWDATNDELDINKTTNITGTLKLSGSTSGFVGLAPAAAAGSTTYTLPSADGSSGQVLSTNGSGTLSWASDANSGGDITDVTAGAGLTGGGSSGNVTLTVGAGTGMTVNADDVALNTASTLTHSGVWTLSGDWVNTANPWADNEVSDTLTASIFVGSGSTSNAVDLATAEVSGTLPDASISFSLDDAYDDSGASPAVTVDTGSGAAGLEFQLTGKDFLIDGLDSSDVVTFESETNDDTVSMYVNDTATANQAEFRITPSDGGVVIDTTGADELTSSPADDTDARNALAIATNPDATGDSDGVIKLGKDGGEWEYIWYDASKRSGKGQFVFSEPIKVEGDDDDSPASIEFDDGSGTTHTLVFDSTAANPFQFSSNVQATALEVVGESPAVLTFGNSTAKVSLIYDPSSDAIWFSKGTFSQQFRSLVKNGSFEAFSALETFTNAGTSCPPGATCGGAGNTFQGGWGNFAPDEWLWESGRVFQNAPMLFMPSGTIDATNLQEDFYHGKSAVTLEDDKPTVTNTYNDTVTNYGTINDAHIEQTITGLKPNTVYAVGAYMRRGGSAAEAIVDITGEEIAASTTLGAGLSSDDNKMTVSSYSSFPTNGIAIVTTGASSERISYTGKESPNKLTGLIRGFEGTTAAAHNSGDTVTIAPFTHLTTGTGAANNFTLYKAQFVTTSKADDVKIHLICKGTDTATPANNQCRFDAVQVVEGRSVPEFQPSSIVDTGDQTLYGSLRMGRTANDRGGVLSVDKSVRTRAIEFFEKDPGMSGTAGGFGNVSPATKMAGPSTGTLSTTGTYTGVDPTDIKVTINAGDAGGTTFKWAKSTCTPTSGCSAFVDQETSLSVQSIQANAVALGTTGIKVYFSSTVQAGDEWMLHTAGADLAAQYSSFSGTATYTPGQTRIFKDPAQGLVFEDGGTRVTLSQLAGSGIGQPARNSLVNFLQAAGGGGTLAMSTNGTNNLAAGAANVEYWVEIQNDGASGAADQFRWSVNQGSSWTGPVTIDGTAQSLSNGVTVTFSPSPYNAGKVGDRWTFTAYPPTNSSAIKTLNYTSPILVTGTGDSRTVALDGTGCLAGYVWKRNGANNGWECAADSGIGAEADGVVGNEITDVANATLSRSGTGSGADQFKVALNLGNANTWTAVQTFANASGLTTGEDKAPGTANTAGSLKFISAGDNALSTTINAGTQTGNVTYTLPTAAPAANGYVLSSTTGGTLSWVADVTGASSFDQITGGTNTAAAMVVGTGASLGVSGTGTITATDLTAGSEVVADTEVVNDLTLASTKAGSFKPTTDVVPLTLQRGTDTTPAADLLKITNAAANSNLFVVNASGQLTAGDVPWARLSSVPAGLADGDDNTTYTAGNGLSLTGTSFAVKLDTSPGLALDATNGLSLLRSCGSNQLLKWNGTAWGCADDSGVGAEADGIVGNEVTDAANTTLTRSGAGTTNDPYKLAVNLGSANTWTAAQTVNPGTTPADAAILDIAALGVAGSRDSHNLVLTGRAYDTGAHNADWKLFNDVTSNAGASTLTIQSRIDAASFANRLTLTDGGSLTVPGTLTVGSSANTITTAAGLLDAAKLSIASEASGDVLYRGASGWTRLAKGTDGQVLKLASGLPGWGTDTSGGSIILDLADDGTNESTGIGEVAITNDTNAIFSEPAADKLLIDLSKAVPKADALAADPADCATSTHFAVGVTASGAATCEAIADADVPDTITASNYVLKAGDTMTFGASGALTIDASTTANTTTTGVVDLNVTSATANNIGFNIDYTGDAALGDTLIAERINMTRGIGIQQLKALYVSFPNTVTSGSGTALGLQIENLDADFTANDGIWITSAAGGITDAIDVSDADITNALNVGDNVITGTTAVIDFTNFDVDASGNATLGGMLHSPYGGLGRFQNLLVRSEEIDDNVIGWAAYCSAVTITANTSDVTAPDGTNNAEKLVAPATLGCGNAASGVLQTGANLTQGQAYTASVWLRGTAGQTLVLGISDDHKSTVTLTADWQRYVVTTTSHSANQLERYLLVYSTTPNQVWYMWGAQLEATSTAGVYAKTTTSAVSAGRGLVTSTLRVPNSTALPGTCAVGDAYMDTDATAGQRFYLCQAANTWALQGDGNSAGTSLPVADTQTIVKGSVDATKLVRFEVDGLTTGTTRVLTVQDADGTLALTGHAHAAGDITSGNLALARGGTGADLSATGGTNQFVKQASAGGAFTVGTIGASELPSGGYAADFVNVTGDTMTGALTLNVAGTDITTVTDADLTIDATGSGKTIIADDVDISGHAAIGGSASVSATELVTISESIGSSSATVNAVNISPTITSTAAATQRGLYLSPTFSDANFGAFSDPQVAQQIDATWSGTGDTPFSLTALELQPITAASSAALSSVYGAKVRKTFNVAPTNSYGIAVSDFGAAGVTTSYGLYLDDQTGSTKNYEIFLNGAAPVLGLDDAATDATLRVLNPGTGNAHLELEGMLQSPFGGLGRFQNLLKYSEAFEDATSGTSWVETNVTVSATNITAPDGSATAEALAPATAAATNTKQTSGIAAAASTAYTFSLWAKAASGTKAIVLTVGDGASNNTATATLTTDWQRFSVSYTSSGTPSGNVFAQVGDATWTADTIHLWGAQLEKASTAGVYVRTAGDDMPQPRFGLAPAHAFKPGDINRDGYVDSFDHAYVLARTGSCTVATDETVYGVDNLGNPLKCRDADLTGDGAVSAIDALTVTNNWSAGRFILRDNDVVDLSLITPDTTTEGLLLPRATACTGATAEGQVCWKTDTDNLFIGTSSGVKQIDGGGGSSPPFADTQTVVKGSVDATKLVRFEVDGLTTGTTRVLTVQDADGTIALTGHAHAAGDITSGSLALARGGTAADLSGTGAGFLKQATTGAAVTVAALGAGDLPAGGYDSTYVNVGGDTMTGALTLNVAGTDITTVTDAGLTLGTSANGDITLDANGTGKTIVADTLQVTSNALQSASNASDQTISITNPDATGKANVSIEGDLTVSGSQTQTPLIQVGDVLDDYVVEGLLPATSANLTSDISAGTAYLGGKRIRMGSATSRTYTASKDTYVDLRNDGTFQYAEVANAAAEPALAATDIRLAKVVTDVDNITSVVSFRQMVPTMKPQGFDDFVISGLIPADSANLTSNISVGSAYVKGVRIDKPTATSHTYTASKDTYVDLRNDRQFIFTEVANGAGAPALGANDIRVAKVVTDGTEITAVTTFGTGFSSQGTYTAKSRAAGHHYQVGGSGDINGDGAVNYPGDFIGWVEKYFAGTDGLTLDQLARGDVDGDGRFTRDDRFIILNSLAFTNQSRAEAIRQVNALYGADGATKLRVWGDLTVDSAATFGTLRIPNSITLPATCAVGDAYMDTDATTGQRFYLCQATDTWALQGDGGGAGSTLPVADTQTVVKGSVDATKLVRFEVDGLTTGTTRVLTVQDADGTLALSSDVSAKVAKAGDTMTGNLTVSGSNPRYILRSSDANTSDRILDIFNSGASAVFRFYKQAKGTDTTLEYMRINSAGDVGIGTVTPGTKLDVNGTIRAGGTTAQVTTAAGDFTLNPAGNVVVAKPLTYSGTGRPKRTIVLTASGALQHPSAAPTRTTTEGTWVTYVTLDFADAASQTASWIFQVPDSFDSSQPIDVSLNWLSTATTGNVVWTVSLDGKATNQAFDSAFPSFLQPTTATNAVAGQIQQSSAGSYSNHGWEVGEIAVVKISRSGTAGGDTMAAAARLVSVKLEYTVSKESD